MYQNNNRNYNNRGNYKKDSNNQPQRPKKANMLFPIVDKFKVVNTRDDSVTVVDKDVVFDKLRNLQDNGVFGILTENVQVPKELILGPGKKGFGVCGFINKFDFENNTVELTIYANAVEKVKEFTSARKYALEPKIILFNGEFKSFNGFYLTEIND